MHRTRPARFWLGALQSAGQHILAWSVLCFDAVCLLLAAWPASARGVAVIALAAAAFVAPLVTDDGRLWLQISTHRHSTRS